jgi:hypothetical protein
MATAVQNSSGTDRAEIPGQPQNSSGNPNRPIIPGQQYPPGSQIIPVGGIAVNMGSENNLSDLKFYKDSEIEIFVSDLSRYNRVFLVWQGHSPYEINLFYPHSQSGVGGYLSFKIPGEITNAFENDSHIFIRLISEKRSQFSGTISYYLTYQSETEEEKQKKNKAQQQAEALNRENSQKSSGPTNLVLGAMGDTLDGIAGAFKSGAGSSGSSKSVSTAASVSSSKATAVSLGGGGSAQANLEQETTAVQQSGGGAVASTSEISTESQTISQGSTDVSQTISSGTSVESSASGGVSGQISTTRGAVSGGGQVSPAVTAENQVSATGQINASAEVSNQVDVTQTRNVEARALQTPQGAEPATANSSGPRGTTTSSVQPSRGSGLSQSRATGQVSAASAAASGLNLSSSTTSAGAGLPTSGQQTKTSSEAVGQSQNSPSRNNQNIQNKEPENRPKQTSQDSPTGQYNEPKPEAEPKQQKGQKNSKPESKPTVQTKSPASEIANRLKQNDMALRGKMGAPLPEVLPQAQNLLRQPKPEEGKEKQGIKSQASGPASEPGMSAPLGDLPNANRTDDLKPSAQSIDSAKASKNNEESNPESFNQEDQNQGLEKPLGGAAEGITPTGATGDDSQPFGPSGGGPVAPPSARNRDPRSVFQDPRTTGELFGEALRGRVNENPAAYPTVRRLIDKKFALAEKGIGQATSEIWYYGFASTAATFFTGADLMLGAVVMDAYWIFGHRKNPELFPLKLWQKIVTVLANIIPPVLIVIGLALVMVAGCNWPVPASISKVVNYRTTVIGAYIGDDCKYFDVSSITSAGANPSAPPAQVQAGIAPRGQ